MHVNRQRAICGIPSGQSSPSGSSWASSAAVRLASSISAASGANRAESSARPGATGRGWAAPRTCSGEVDRRSRRQRSVWKEERNWRRRLGDEDFASQSGCDVGAMLRTPEPHRGGFRCPAAAAAAAAGGAVGRTGPEYRAPPPPPRPWGGGVEPGGCSGILRSEARGVCE